MGTDVLFAAGVALILAALGLTVASLADRPRAARLATVAVFALVGNVAVFAAGASATPSGETARERTTADYWHRRYLAAIARAHRAEQQAARARQAPSLALMERRVRLAATVYATASWPQPLLRRAVGFVIDCESEALGGPARTIRDRDGRALAAATARNRKPISGLHALGVAQMLAEADGRDGTWGLLAGDFQRAGFTALDPDAAVMAVARAVVTGQLHHHYAASQGCWGRRLREARRGTPKVTAEKAPRVPGRAITLAAHTNAG